MILDGWGISKNPKISAIDKAKTPFIDSLLKNSASSTLITHGKSVGLPKNQMGNSEVGHMNIGAGRIVYQELERINIDFKKKKFSQQINFKEFLENFKKSDKKLHLIGLVSDGGVHSHINHLENIIEICKNQRIKNLNIHAFTDGRDVDPYSGIEFVKRINKRIKSTNFKISSVIGRYFAMDRDNRWERIKKAYDLLTKGVGLKTNNIEEAILKSYEKNISDEFIEPIKYIDKKKNCKGLIEKGDYVIFFNFRTDRGRQLTKVLTQFDYEEFKMNKLDLNLLTMTNYDKNFVGVKSVYNSDYILDTLGETLEKNNKKQLRIAETEKYPHVTFFFNGGKEQPFKNEKRILCPSPKVATYDMKPEMSAFEIRNKTIKELNSKIYDFICLNFANPDMVGHTGNIKAAVKACETVDECCKDIINTALQNNYSIVVISDHGNCDVMKNQDGTPNTAHTKNLVPIIVVDDDVKSVENGILGDIAPTILDLMLIDKPKLMTQKSLIK